MLEKILTWLVWPRYIYKPIGAAVLLTSIIIFAGAWCTGAEQANNENCEAKSLLGFCI